jgi:hypothetical protein
MKPQSLLPFLQEPATRSNSKPTESPYFFKIYFNSLATMPRSPKWSLPFRLLSKILSIQQSFIYEFWKSECIWMTSLGVIHNFTDINAKIQID